MVSIGGREVTGGFPVAPNSIYLNPGPIFKLFFMEMFAAIDFQ